MLALQQWEQVASMLKSCLDEAQRSDVAPTRKRLFQDHFGEALDTDIHLNHYITNDRLLLRGNLGGRKSLDVNSLELELDRRQFLTLLSVFSLTEEPRLGGSSGFFTAQAIIDRIKELFELTGRPRGSSQGAQTILSRAHELIGEVTLDTVWPYPGAEDVHRVVHTLRKKLRENRLNEFLIESARRGDGYRISSSDWNWRVA